tara:strand:+ start:386 stop:1012 length:627 start_codon:yes stop_codon:yes gene_type:complete
MALEKITRIGEEGLEAGNIGIRTTGGVIGTGFTMLNFVGAGNTFAVNGKVVDISIAGGGGGGGSGGVGAALKGSDVESKLLFIHHGGFQSNFDIESPRKFIEVFTHIDATIDIENGISIDIDDDCALIATDKTDFNLNEYAFGISGTNLQRADTFDDQIRSTVTSDITLDGTKKVAYVLIPSYADIDVPFDIENGATVTVDDNAVLVI